MNCSTTLNKPVLRFPQDKLNSSSFFSVYQTQNKKVEVIIGWQIRPLQAEGGSSFTHGDGCAHLPWQPAPAPGLPPACPSKPRTRWECGLPSSPASHWSKTRPGPAPPWLPVFPKVTTSTSKLWDADDPETQRQSGHRVSAVVLPLMVTAVTGGSYPGCSRSTYPRRIEVFFSYFFFFLMHWVWVENQPPKWSLTLVYSLLAPGIKCTDTQTRKWVETETIYIK